MDESRSTLPESFTTEEDSPVKERSMQTLDSSADTSSNFVFKHTDTSFQPFGPASSFNGDSFAVTAWETPPPTTPTKPSWKQTQKQRQQQQQDEQEPRISSKTNPTLLEWNQSLSWQAQQQDQRRRSASDLGSSSMAKILAKNDTNPQPVPTPSSFRYVVRMESKSTATPAKPSLKSATKPSWSSSQNPLTACVNATDEVVKQVKFDDEVMDAFERSQSEFSRMVQTMSRASSEPIQFTGPFGRTASCGGASTTDVSESFVSLSPTFEGDATWQRSVTDHWNSFITTPTDGGSATADAQIEADPAGKPKSDPSPPLESTATTLQPEPAAVKPSLARFTMDHAEPAYATTTTRNAKTAISSSQDKKQNPTMESVLGDMGGNIKGFIGSINDGVTSMAAEAHKSKWMCPKEVLKLVDCSQADSPEELVNLSAEAGNSPLDASWFSIQDSDSISKLTNPQDLSALESLGISLDLTEIPKVDEDRHQSHLPRYDF